MGLRSLCGLQQPGQATASYVKDQALFFGDFADDSTCAPEVNFIDGFGKYSKLWTTKDYAMHVFVEEMTVQHVPNIIEVEVKKL